MSELTSQIPFMASLWIRSGYDVKVEVSAQTYQVGAHFKALNKAVLVALLKTFEKFFSISRVAEAPCVATRGALGYLAAVSAAVVLTGHTCSRR